MAIKLDYSRGNVINVDMLQRSNPRKLAAGLIAPAT